MHVLVVTNTGRIPRMRRLCTTCNVEPPDSEAIQQVPRTFYHSTRSWPTYRREIPGDLSPTKWQRPPEPPPVWTALPQESLPQGHPSRGKLRICASIEEIPRGKSYDLPARGGGRQSPCGTQRSAPSRCQIANSIPIPSASPTAAAHDGGNAHDQTSAPSALSAVARLNESSNAPADPCRLERCAQ